MILLLLATIFAVSRQVLGECPITNASIQLDTDSPLELADRNNLQLVIEGITTGSQALSVVWRRNGNIVNRNSRPPGGSFFDGGGETIVRNVSCESQMYRVSLQVTGYLRGSYTYTVSNDATPTPVTSPTFEIEDPGRPTNLALRQVSNQRVQATWSSPDLFSHATYRVYINTADVNSGGIEVTGTTYTTDTFAEDSNVTVIVRSTTGTYLSVPSEPASLSVVGDLGTPTNLVYSVSGARTIRLSWTYPSMVIQASVFRVSVLNIGGPTTTYITNSTNITINGLMPYDYEGPNGLQYVATVQAVDSSSNLGTVRSTSILLIPPCPGVCNYRYFTTTTSSCSSAMCTCSSAYSGEGCATPTFVPRNVAGSYTPLPDALSRTIITWDAPLLSNLDGRLVVRYRVVISTIGESSMVLFNNSVGINPESNENSLTTGEVPFSVALDLNIMVTVQTIADDSDTAESDPVAIATHAPGPVRNLTAVILEVDAIRVTWEPPSDDDGLVTLYQLEWPTVVQLGPDVRSYVINSSLSSGTDYVIRVAARNVQGLGQATSFNITTPNALGIPSNLVYTVSGARTVHLSWTYPSMAVQASVFRVSLILVDGPTTIHITPTTNITINGLMPYDYEGSNGIQFVASVQAVDSSSNLGDPVSTGNILVPPCPGVCNYRYFTTTTSSCSSAMCTCSSAYSGEGCATPTFVPRNVVGSYTPLPDALSRTIITWNAPLLSNLAGKLVVGYRVVISTISESSMVLFNNSVSINPDSNENRLTTGEVPFSVAFDLNIMVTVQTIADDSDTAESEPVAIATHVPGPVRNLTAVILEVNAIRVTWEPPSDDDGLVIQYQLEWPTVVQLGPDARSYVINSSLSSGTDYVIRVAARNVQGLGQSTSFNITTPISEFSTMPVSTFAPTGPVTSSIPTGSDSTFAPTEPETSDFPTRTDSTFVPTGPDTSDFPTRTDSTFVPTGPDTSDFPARTDSTFVPTGPETSDFPTGTDSTFVPTGPETSDFPTTGSDSNVAPTGQVTDDSTEADSTFKPTGPVTSDSTGTDFTFAPTGLATFDSTDTDSTFAPTGPVTSDSTGTDSTFAPTGPVTSHSTNADSTFASTGPVTSDSTGTDSTFAPTGPATSESSTTPVSTLPISTLPISTLPMSPPQATTLMPTSVTSLPAPDNFHVFMIGATSARFSWQSVSGAGGYKIIYSNIAGGSSQTQDIIGFSVLEVTVTLLQPFSNYSFTIAAVNSAGLVGQETDPLYVITLEAAPSPPRDVRIEEDESTLLVTWAEPVMPNGIITEYIIIVTSTMMDIFRVEGNVTFIRVSLPLSSYSVTVEAVNGAGKSMRQEAVVVDSTQESTMAGRSFPVIPIVVGVVGGILLFIFLSVMLVLCWWCCRRKNNTKHVFNTGGKSRDRSNKYLLTDQTPMKDPGNRSTPLSYHNPMAEGSLAMGSVQTHESDFTLKNLKALEAAEDQYSEITEEQRLKSVEIAAKVVPSKDATPADYNNEDLYMEMEKLYYSNMGDEDILDSFEFKRSAIELMEEIGKGQFGRVVKARAKRIIPGEPTSLVAVKMLKDNADDKTRKDFFSEAQLLAKFGSHPNVMGLLKVIHRSQPAMVITHFMPHGDLKHYLRKCQRENNKNVGTLEQIKISEQIAYGMEYLASKFFVHRDLAARNILVGEKNMVKISDFGLSRTLAKDDSYYKVSQASKLPVKWMALESLLFQKFSTYSDVWSFGVTMWEIFAYGESPYPGIKGMNITDYIQKGNRLPSPLECPETVYSIMNDCWKVEKEKRPSFTQLKTVLKAQAIVCSRKSVLNSAELTESNNYYS